MEMGSFSFNASVGAEGHFNANSAHKCTKGTYAQVPFKRYDTLPFIKNQPDKKITN